MIRRLSSLWRKTRACRIVVLDDFFPNVLTAFRVAEYNAYLNVFPYLQVFSTVADFSARQAEYAALYPQHAHRVRLYDPRSLAGAGLAYLNFLNNAAYFLADLEQHQIPFLLTMYPGGGLGLNESESDTKLTRVLSSPMLRGIITTQPVTHTYVCQFVAQHGLKIPLLHHIPGGVIQPVYFSSAAQRSAPYFGQGKTEFDIAFVAEKYMPLGANKGYPEFISAALALGDVPTLRFHVVGSFTRQDIDASPLGNRIRWHGTLETSKLRQLLTGIDLVVSPNRPYTLHAGNFDGFPTGGCVEASLSGVAIMATDELALNRDYIDGKDLLLIKPDAASIESKIRELVAEPVRVASIACNGQSLARRLYAPEFQIGQRLDILRQLATSRNL